MRRFIKYSILTIALLAVIFMFGPRPQTDAQVTFNKDMIGDNPKQYLAASESKISNLVEGAEKEIIWADPTAQSQTEVSIVYIHGFSATKHETRPVTDRVAETLGANVFYTRLTGHGQDGAAMAQASIQDWVNDYAEAIAIGEKLGKKVIVISASTGSTITTWGLTQPVLVKNVAGVVMISANYELQGLSTQLANIPWAETILPTIAGEERSWEPVNEQHGKWWTTAYPSRAVFPMMGMLKSLKSIDKSTINVPSFFIYSPDDKVIVADEIKKVASQWGGPSTTLEIKETSDPFKHVIAGDILSPENTGPVSNAIIKWLDEIL